MDKVRYIEYLLALVFVAGPFVLIFLALLLRYQQVKLMVESGAIATGVVTAVASNTRWGLRHTVTFSVKGRQFLSQACSNKVGEKVTVVYDPTDPNKSLVVENYPLRIIV